MQNSVARSRAVCLAASTSSGMFSQTARTGEANWPDWRAEVAVLGAAAGLERHDALDLDLRPAPLHPHLVRQREQVLEPVVGQSAAPRPAAPRSAAAPLEHLLAGDVEDVGPGHLCGHGPDCCVCRGRARGGSAAGRAVGAVPRLRPWRPPRPGCWSWARCALRAGQRLPDPPRAHLVGGRPWAHINPGSIYSGLTTLTKQGLAPPRPAGRHRTVSVYTTSDGGRAEFARFSAGRVDTVGCSTRGSRRRCASCRSSGGDVIVGHLDRRVSALEQHLADLRVGPGPCRRAGPHRRRAGSGAPRSPAVRWSWLGPQPARGHPGRRCGSPASPTGCRRRRPGVGQCAADAERYRRALGSRRPS